MNFQSRRLIILFLAIFVLFSGVLSTTQAQVNQSGIPGIIEDPDDKKWIQANCQKTKQTRKMKYPYNQYECVNPEIEVNLINRDRSRQGIEFSEQRKTIHYQIELALRESDGEYFYDQIGSGSLQVTVTGFGPKKDFLTTFGSKNFKKVQVRNTEGNWISARSYTGYGLDTPITVPLDKNRNQKATLDARITVKRPLGFRRNVDKLNIFSSFVNVSYDQKKRVWINELEQTSKPEEVSTEEGVTIRAVESPHKVHHVAGELESVLSVSPERNQATLILTQTRTNPGKDTAAAVYLRSWENLAKNSSNPVEDLSPPAPLLVGEQTNLTGEGSIYKQQVPGIPVNCFNGESGQFEVQINYQLLEGKVGEEPTYESSVQGVALRNPAPFEKGACGE